MLLNTLLFGLGVAHVAVAHTVMTTLYVDGVSQGDGTCVRMNNNIANEATYPVNDTTSNDMACGIGGEQGVNFVCAANQASTLTFQFKMYPDGSASGVIADSHKGPCAVYLKQVDSAKNDPGYGDGWFKIWDSGYDEENEEWCTTKLINNGGYLSVQLPEDIAGGYYLARTELLALHNAYDLNNPQFYVGCSQLFLRSDATSLPSDTVSIPGYVTMGEPSLYYNIFADPLDLPYPIAGPDPYEGENAPSNVVGKRNLETVQTEGLKPKGCILTSANWCGMALKSYSDNAGCWNGSHVCWDEFRDCVNKTGAIGSDEYCSIFEDYCQSINDACNAENYAGPPDASHLQPSPVTLSLSLSTPTAATYGDVNGGAQPQSIISSRALPATASGAARNTVYTTTHTTTSTQFTVIQTRITTAAAHAVASPVIAVTDYVWETVIDYIGANGQNYLTTLTPGQAFSGWDSSFKASASSAKASSALASPSKAGSSLAVKSQATPVSSAARVASSAIEAPSAVQASTGYNPSSTTSQVICQRDGPSENELREQLRKEVVREVRAEFARKEKTMRAVGRRAQAGL